MIKLNNLSKSFPSRRGTVEAVRGISLEVNRNEIFGFLGPNGAGKSTSMRMLATLLAPTAGNAEVAGLDLATQPHEIRKRIGYVSQLGGLHYVATGRESLIVQGRLHGMNRADAESRAEELVQSLGLTPFADRRTATYSGGQKRLTDVAMAIMHRPLVLFMDEPTTGLDPQNRAEVWREVRKFRSEGTTVFLTTHYMDEADALCDRLAIIDRGKIVGQGTPAELKRQISGDVIFLGVDLQDERSTQAQADLAKLDFVRELRPVADGMQFYVDQGDERLPMILRLVEQTGVRVRKIGVNRPSLDDVFLRLTGHRFEEAPQDSSWNAQEGKTA